MTASPTIDMMALADIGQPKRLAFEIHKQLRVQYGSVPRRSPLVGIAAAVGIVGIKEFETTGFEGTLVLKEGVGAIGLCRGMRSGRRNFTLGHEIGHFMIPAHRLRKTQFECTPQFMRYERGDAVDWNKRSPLERIEVEANEFSAALLVPIPEYREERSKCGRGADVAHVRPLADLFDVSQEMMARVYVDYERETSAIVTSHHGQVRRVIAKADFPWLGLRYGMEVPRISLTREFRVANDSGAVSKIEEVDIHTWIEAKGRITALSEQVILQRDGWAMTLLCVEVAEEDDEADDRNWNRRNVPRRSVH